MVVVLRPRNHGSLLLFAPEDGAVGVARVSVTDGVDWLDRLGGGGHSSDMDMMRRSRGVVRGSGGVRGGLGRVVRMGVGSGRHGRDWVVGNRGHHVVGGR